MTRRPRYEGSPRASGFGVVGSRGPTGLFARRGGRVSSRGEGAARLKSGDCGRVEYEENCELRSPMGHCCSAKGTDPRWAAWRVGRGLKNSGPLKYVECRGFEEGRVRRGRAAPGGGVLAALAEIGEASWRRADCSLRSGAATMDRACGGSQSTRLPLNNAMKLRPAGLSGSASGLEESVARATFGGRPQLIAEPFSGLKTGASGGGDEVRWNAACSSAVEG